MYRNEKIAFSYYKIKNTYKNVCHLYLHIYVQFSCRKWNLKKINEHSTSKYFVTIGIYRYISNKSLQFAVFIFIKIFHAKTFLNKLMKKCLLLLKTLECIVFRGQLIQWLLFQKSNYTSLIQLQSKLLQVIKFESYYIFFTHKKIYLYI